MLIDGHELTLVHERPDRRIYEYSGVEGSIQFTEVLELTVLGNHYHKNKDENFEILAGGGVLCLQVIFSPTNKAMLPHMHVVLMKPGFKYRVAPWEAHALVLEPGTELVCRSDKPWDPADKHSVKLVAT